MAIFQIYGGSANDEVAAFGNGLTLAVVSEPQWSLCYCCMCYATVQDACCFALTHCPDQDMPAFLSMECTAVSHILNSACLCMGIAPEHCQV